jgi:hypothetical protein
MREDRLSPRLGRLIDAAKAAAQGTTVSRRTTGSATSRTNAQSVAGSSAPVEAVALLCGSDAVYAVCSSDSGKMCRAAAEALDAARAAGEYEILAAAVAWRDATAADVLPCQTCRAALAAIDPDLDVVVKRMGRWVLLPLSSLSPILSVSPSAGSQSILQAASREDLCR